MSQHEETRSGIVPEFDVTTLLVVAGTVLFVVPEPITSVLGAGLIALGLLGWLASHLL